MKRQGAEIYKQTIQFISKHNLEATPIIYLVCYEYFLGIHPLLSRAIDKAIMNKAPITTEVMQCWHDTFLLGYGVKDLNQVQTDVKKITNQLVLTTTQEEDNAFQFDGSLGDCKQKVGETTNSYSLSSAVSQLLSTSSSMQLAMEQMKQQIKASEQEILSLQDRLEIAALEALTDPLTELTNRKGLSMALEESLYTVEKSAARPPCLLMLDIDHFKNINDSFGHTLGDKAIKMVASTLKNQIKGKDTAARYGGEEFSVLLPETELTNARVVAENIRRMIESMSIKRAHDKQEICRMTISIGIARYQFNESITDFIARADSALYQSKNTGRNRITVFAA